MKAVKILKADKKYQVEIDGLNKLKAALEAGKLAKSVELTEEEQEMLKDLFLLTSKPFIYIANVAESQIENIENDENVAKVKDLAKQENTKCIPLFAKIEEEL